jgi:FKBP-type peptidyl-prolyl cis-trans isomerase
MYYTCFNLIQDFKLPYCHFKTNLIRIKVKNTRLSIFQKNIKFSDKNGMKNRRFYSHQIFSNLSVNNSEETNSLEDLTNDRGVIKKILKTGQGTNIKDGYTVKVHYEGKLESGIIFDSSYERREPYVFVVGEGKVIKGWEICIKSMRVGEKAQLEIMPIYGYKKKGIPPIIPPDAKLFFEIELLEAFEYVDSSKNFSSDLNGKIPRTPVDIAKDYENRSKKKNKENVTTSFENFFFISPFRSQTGEKAPWWLNPNITFILVFFFVIVLFGIVISIGGIHQGYVEQNFDANFLKK